MKQLPTEYVNRMKEILGDEYHLYEESLKEEPVKGFRVNTDKISLEDFLLVNEFSDGNVPYVENGFYLNYEKVGIHPYHHAGIIYVQEPSAMAPAESIDINPDSYILDL